MEWLIPLTFRSNSFLSHFVIMLLRFGLATEEDTTTYQLHQTKADEKGRKKTNYCVQPNELQDVYQQLGGSAADVNINGGWCGACFLSHLPSFLIALKLILTIVATKFITARWLGLLLFFLNSPHSHIFRSRSRERQH